MSEPLPSPDPISSDGPYKKIIVAVHGIGKQSRNSTIRSVTLMAAQNLPKDRRSISSSYPLGYFYAGVNAAVNVSPFDEIPDGETELREVGFAEVFWADIPQAVVSESRTMEESKEWARTVVARAQRLYDRNYPDAGEEGGDGQKKEKIIPPDFGLASEVLDEIIDTIYVLENLSWLAEQAGIMSFDVREIMDEYLGDVQLVAEFSHYRTDIVGRFHRAMESIHQRNPGAEIHIVAHSEGSVVAFLGLLNAISRIQVVPATKDAGPSTAKSDEPLKWLSRVRGFMTIGSPIDKHYLLWPKLFEDFDLRCSQDLIASGKLKEEQIKWRNYYDLGDPVGYKLETIRMWLGGGACQPVPERTATPCKPTLETLAAGIARKLTGTPPPVKADKQPDYEQDERRLCKLFEFEPHHDIGFTRYLLPGKAHNDYWDDAELFDHFIREVVKPPATTGKPGQTPGDRRGVGAISRSLPFLLSAVLLCAAAYILLRGILSFYVPAVEPIDHYMRMMVVGYSSPSMEYSWIMVLQEFGGWALMLAGTTLGARVHRLGGLRRFWWPISAIFIVVGAHLVNGRMILSFMGKDNHDDCRPLMVVVLSAICLLTMVASDWLGMRKCSFKGLREQRSDDARERRLRWLRKGARPLVLLGSFVTLTLAILPSFGNWRIDREHLGKAISSKFIYRQDEVLPFEKGTKPAPSDAEGEKLIDALPSWLKFSKSRGISGDERKKKEIRWSEKFFQAAASARLEEARMTDPMAASAPVRALTAEAKADVIKKVAEDYESIFKVLQVTPPVWPLVLSWLAFCYLWWLSILIFDLAYVWHRYVRRGTAIDRLRHWMRKDWSRRADGVDSRRFPEG